MDEVNKSGPYYEAVSLCYFNGNDSGWSWTRVADIKNGELTTFLYNPDEPYFYENRNFLIDKTGKVHTKGDLAVFAWSDSPNASGSDKPFNDATELKDFPIHVFKLSAKNTLQVIDNLRNGVSCGSTSHDVMYIFCESDEGLQGVLCPAQSMEERNQQYFLKDSVSKLPYYLLKSSDILSISDLKNLFGNEKYVFLKALVPGTPISYLPTRETSAIIKDVILKNRFLTWNSFRNFTSNAEGSHKYTQKELRVFKECLAQVQCKTVQEELAAELGCTVSEATTYIENFIENANSYLEGDEVDTQLLSRLVMANDELREKYTALVEEKWKTDAAEKINIAAQRVEELEAQCKEKANTLETLNSDIEKNRSILQELQGEVARNTTLAQKSYSIVQEKIATAKNDVSHFLAEMACYLPNATTLTNSAESTSGDYVNGTALESDKVKTFDNWESLVDELRSNLGLDKLLHTVQAGDTIVFDSVSRMSRNADEGCQLYEALYAQNVTLCFLKEPHINTETYRQTIQRQISTQLETGNAATDSFVSSVIAALNQYTVDLAKEQIRLAFAQAQKEVDDLHQRTREGMLTAKLNGKQIGQECGRKLIVKKAATCKEAIKKYSKDFDGTLSDADCIKLIGIARNTYYKYKRELREAMPV